MIRRPRPLERLPLRLAGVLVVALLVVLYQPDAQDPIQRLLVPVGLAVGAWMLVQNLAAVALGAGVLALIHSDPGSADPISGVAYPALAALAAFLAGAVFVRRFRRHIAATHDARWRHRRRSAAEHER